MNAIEQATTILIGAGFEKKDSPFPGLGVTYVRGIQDGWRVGAHATDKNEVFERCDFFLKTKDGEHYGTEYRVLSLEALQREVSSIVEKLSELARNEELLRCPECKTRRVTLKERNSDGRPFLSCEGASMLYGRGPNKGFLCRGSSRAIPARVEIP
jgi:DNA-directed RNA polymerase subunit RPC12/RpoP